MTRKENNMSDTKDLDKIQEAKIDALNKDISETISMLMEKHQVPGAYPFIFLSYGAVGDENLCFMKSNLERDDMLDLLGIAQSAFENVVGEVKDEISHKLH